MSLQNNFYETYGIRERDIESFQNTLHTLLSQTFLNRYEFRDGKKAINPRYAMADKYYAALSDYLEIAGLSLERDSEEGVIYLRGEESASRVRLNKITTLFLYAARLLYEKKRKSVLDSDGIHMYRTSTREIIDTMLELGLIDKEPTITERMNAQKELARFNILQKLDPAWENEGNELVLYSSILHMITNQAIYRLSEQFQNLKETGSSPEDADSENHPAETEETEPVSAEIPTGAAESLSAEGTEDHVEPDQEGSGIEAPERKGETKEEPAEEVPSSEIPSSIEETEPAASAGPVGQQSMFDLGGLS